MTRGTVKQAGRLDPHDGSAPARRAAWLALLAVLLVPAHGYAFSFAEHFRIGHDAYQHACYLLRANLTSAAESAAAEKVRAERLALACPENEQLRDDLARVFGQAVALSGDHVGSPKELGRPEGLRAALSLTNYAKLGLENFRHFRPSSKLTWQRYHAEALELAFKGAKPRYARRQFDELIRHLAFGEHFLQDAFAAGHMGFNRPASTPVASMIYHDFYNTAGRVLASTEGSPLPAQGKRKTRDFWVSYGDYHLCEGEQSKQRCRKDAFGNAQRFLACMCAKSCPVHHTGHREAHLRVHAAATASVLEVLYSYVTKQREMAPEIATWRLEDERQKEEAIAKDEQVSQAAAKDALPEDIKVVQDLLLRQAEKQFPAAYCIDEYPEKRGCRVQENKCPEGFQPKEAPKFVALDTYPKRTYVGLAPLIEMRVGTGLVGNRDYGFWMPTLGLKALGHVEFVVGYATPPPFRENHLWKRAWSSLYLRLVGETPSVNVDRTPVSGSMVGGLISEVCLQNCVAHRASDNLLVGMTLGPKLSLEALSALLGLSVEPFLLWNRNGRATFGLTFAFSVAKPVMARGLFYGGNRYSGPD